MSNVHAAFALTPPRLTLLTGLLSYRAALRKIGITNGFQLIDGSFTEDCEGLRGRPPDDVDVLTFALVPGTPAQRLQLRNANMGLFSSAAAKATYHCHAFFIDLQKPPHLLVSDTAYWFSLFSHQRVTALWKGVVQVPLMSDDAVVQQLIATQPVVSPNPGAVGP